MHGPVLALVTALALCGPGSGCAAEELGGKVVAVGSGDTLTVQTDAGPSHVVRLFAIAAPHMSQPYHSNARQHLHALAMGQIVSVQWSRKDEQGRILGKALVAEPGCKPPCAFKRDLGLAQLENGWAWWLRAERKEQSLHDQGYYEYAEFDARQRRIGLWLANDPVPPWEWRRQHQPLTRSTPGPGPEPLPSYSTALVMSSTTFLASPKTIMVLSM